MIKSENIKEKLIYAATELITNSTGNIDSISSRAIAESADTSAALINYHFQTKDNLVNICIQRIISGVVLSFKVDTNIETDSIARFKVTAKSVVDFMCENEAISRISILGDMDKPNMNDNTTNTMKGFSRGLSELDMPDGQKQILVFMLTSVIQSVFLRRNMCEELLQFDFENKLERDLFIDFIIDRLFCEGGNKNHENINH